MPDEIKTVFLEIKNEIENGDPDKAELFDQLMYLYDVMDEYERVNN